MFLNKKCSLLPGVLFLVSFLCGVSAFPQNGENEERKIEWGAELASELQVTQEGESNFANVLRLKASVPVCKSLSIDVSSLTTYMTSEMSIGNDLQVFSNLDAENIAFTLAVCGVDWKISDRHTLFMGIRNMNEDYFCSPVTSFFTNSSCGINPTVSWNFPIANYPVASVGAHYSYAHPLPSADETSQDAIILQASLYNGIGYNRFTGRENMFRFCPKSDGLFGLAQVEYRYRGSCYFLGASVRSTDEVGFPSGTALWTYGEQRVTDRLSLIADYSHSFASDSFCTDFVGIGGKYSWNNCELGLFTDYAHFDGCEEFATELTCKLQLTPIISIQPTTHFIATSTPFTSGKEFTFAAALRLGIAI